MKIVRKECVDCGLPCLGTSCPYWAVPVTFCDLCGEEMENDAKPFLFHPGDICQSCREKIEKAEEESSIGL